MSSIKASRPAGANAWVEFDCQDYHVRALAPFKRFRGLDIPWDHPESLVESSERVVKASRSRKVVKLGAGHFGAPVEVYVKRYNLKTWLRVLLRSMRKTRAREEFDLGWRLMEKGIRTPRPVWLAEASGRMTRYSLLATEALPFAESALERWIRCGSEKERHELLTALGHFIAQLHDIGLYHDDCKAGHVLIFPDRPSLAKEFYIIDLLGSSFPPVLTRVHRAKNLYQIVRSFKPRGDDFGFTDEHRYVFLLAYSGSPIEAAKWSSWVNRVGKMKGREV
jgi:tRNA A-37 threonylcarbamoyl transferase component Bud32